MSSFPRYLMIVNGNRLWLDIGNAGVAFDSGWVPVRIGGKVIEEDGTERDVTDEEKQRISDIAEEYSASK